MSSLIGSLQQIRALMAEIAAQNDGLLHMAIVGGNYYAADEYRDLIPQCIGRTPESWHWYDRMILHTPSARAVTPGYLYSRSSRPRDDTLVERFQMLCDPLPELHDRLVGGLIIAGEGHSYRVLTALHELAGSGTSMLVRVKRGRIWRLRTEPHTLRFQAMTDTARLQPDALEMVTAGDRQWCKELDRDYDLAFPHDHIALLKPDVFTATVALIDKWLQDAARKEIEEGVESDSMARRRKPSLSKPSGRRKDKDLQVALKAIFNAGDGEMKPSEMLEKWKREYPRIKKMSKPAFGVAVRRFRAQQTANKRQNA